MSNNRTPKSNDALENEEFETTHIEKNDSDGPAHTNRDDEEN